MKTLPLLVATLAAAVLAGCGKKADHDHAGGPARHEHKAPHDGTPVVLGQEAFHLELVRDTATGTLTAYVLDGEMENFVRVKAPAFEIVATVGAERRPLAFLAVANSATGETVGDTSQFEAQADWLKATANFDATLTALEVKGTAFKAVAFNFPKGNDKD